MLHLKVEHRLHVRRPGIAENGASTQGSRAEFHSSLEPSNCLLFHEGIHGSREYGGVIKYGEPGPSADQAFFNLWL
jgi:hypothetical protein